MQRNASWRPWFAAAAVASLSSCGGGEALALLGFIGSAGGDWLQDDQPGEQAGTIGLQLRSTCGPGAADDCTINIQPASGTESLFAEAFDVTFTSNLPGCVASGTGHASGRRLVLGNCFSGEYVTINQAVSDDGTTRMFFDFTPDLTQGIWVEIQKGQRRFAFDNDTDGCELTAPVATPVALTVSNSDVNNPAGPFETTVSSFAIGGGAAWQGRFVGVSGLHLTRGNEVLELERRASNETCPP
jgi:hypothetical protein